MRYQAPIGPSRRARGFRDLPWMMKGLTFVAAIFVLAGIGSCVFAVVSFLDYYRANEHVPAAGAGTPAEADVRNAELMASLPMYPRSVLVEKDTWNELCCHPAQLYRHLTYMYASDAGMDEVLAFYRARLINEGWDYDGVGTAGDWFQKKNIDLIVTPLGPTSSVNLPYELRKKVPVATPPAGLSAYFAITASRRIDCLRAECLEIDRQQ